MHVTATTGVELLEAILFRLHMTGWTQVPVDKLVDVYLEFAARASRCVYGTDTNDPSRRDRLYDKLAVDIDDLVARDRAQRTVSRVFLTPKGMVQAAWLKPMPALYGSLLPAAEHVFPPRSLMAPAP